MKKITIAVSMFLISIATVSALEINISSYSMSELKSLLAQVKTRIHELEKDEVKKCFVTESNISLGDGEGTLMNDVKKLQEFLREKGYFQNKSTGYFGKLTRTALISYQVSVGVPQTGEFDVATREKAHTGTCALAKHEEKRLKKEERKEEKREDKKEHYERKWTSDSYQSTLVSISLATSSANGVMWSTVGTSTYGYKIVWSKVSSPTYPTRGGDYAEFYEAHGNKASLKAFSGAGIYYVRVCEYLNGKCGVYSNEIKLELN